MKIKNILVLIGPPGSGKGTQGKLLAPKLDYNYLSMGQALREFSQGDSDHAQEVRSYIDRGHIIPDNLIRELFHEKLRSLPPAKGVILDGFPRDIGQVPLLNEVIEKHQVLDVCAVFIDVPKVKILDRLKVRARLESRADDDPAVIETRFHEYDSKTFPLVDYFHRKYRLVTVNGDQEIEAVQAEMERKLVHA